jgi:FkbM family methyltransferase
MTRMPRRLFLSICRLVRLLPNSPRSLRSAVAYRIAPVAVHGRATVDVGQGLRVDADLDDWLQRLLCLGEVYGPLRRALMSLVPEGGTFGDVGANVGVFTCSLARHVGPDGRCHAFEPLPGNAAALVRNIQLNNLSNVTCHEVALSDDSGPFTLFAPPGHRGETTGSAGEKLASDYVAIAEATRAPLDSFDLGPRIDAIKIHVNSHELSILRGAERTLARHRPAVLILVIDPDVYAETLAFARSRDYEVREVDRRGRLVPHETSGPLRVASLVLVPREGAGNAWSGR